MKWLLILVLLIGALIFYEAILKPAPKLQRSGGQEAQGKGAVELQKAEEAKKREEASAKDSEESRLAADKTAQEARAQAEADKKKAEELARESAAKAKRGELEQLKEKAAKLKEALELSASRPVEEFAIDPTVKQKAVELKQKLKETSQSRLEAKARLDALQKQRNSAANELVMIKSTSERTGWRWATEPEGVVRPMSELPEHRTKAVKYIYKKESEQDRAVSQLEPKLNEAKSEFQALDKQLEQLNADYEKLAKDCKRQLSEDYSGLVGKSKTLLAELDEASLGQRQ